MDEKAMRFPTKFRAWSQGTGGYPAFMCGDDSIEVVAGQECELSACTEIPDKNGRLIWTGDIVRMDKSYMLAMPEMTQEEFDALQEFEEAVIDDPTDWRTTQWPAHGIVIGNKWEGKHG